MRIGSRVRSLLSRAMRWDSVAGWSIVTGTQPTSFQRDGKTIRRLGWEKHPVVNACVRAIADLIAAVPFEVYRQLSDGTTEVVTGSPLGTLLQTPRATVPGYHHRARTAVHYLLFGNSFWMFERPGPRRPPTGLRIVSPENVQYVYLGPESDEIAAYDWTDLQGRMHPKVPVQDVLHFRDLDASDGLFGYPRLAAAISDVAADSEAIEVGAGDLELVADLAGLVDHLLAGEGVGEAVMGHRVDGVGTEPTMHSLKTASQETRNFIQMRHQNR